MENLYGMEILIPEICKDIHDWENHTMYKKTIDKSHSDKYE